jgi:hypothetical protein
VEGAGLVVPQSGQGLAGGLIGFWRGRVFRGRALGGGTGSTGEELPVGAGGKGGWGLGPQAGVINNKARQRAAR